MDGLVTARFAPDANAARAAARRIHERLADSLAHIGEEAAGQLDFDRAALDALTAGLAGGDRYPPSTFALYYDLVDAIFETRHGDAERLLAAIVAERPARPGIETLLLDDATFGAETVERYGRQLDTDAAVPHSFGPPDPAVVPDHVALIDESLDLMRRGCPETWAEFREIVCQVILASGTNHLNGEDFLAGSSFTVWGAVFLNPTGRRTPRTLIETLAHEAAHSLLFTLQIDDPLVLNPDSERYKSPVRDDPRPIDGIFHAGFVAARMHFAMDELLRSGLLDEERARFARSGAAQSLKAGAESMGIVRRHGRLTPAGQAILADIEGYFARAAA